MIRPDRLICLSLGPCPVTDDVKSKRAYCAFCLSLLFVHSVCALLLPLLRDPAVLCASFCCSCVYDDDGVVLALFVDLIDRLPRLIVGRTWKFERDPMSGCFKRIDSVVVVVCLFVSGRQANI